MNRITFELGDKQLADLKAWAEEAGLQPEELVRELVEAEVEAQTALAEDFTPEQRRAIEEGLEAITQGRVAPQEEVFAKAKKIVDLRKLSGPRGRNGIICHFSRC